MKIKHIYWFAFYNPASPSVRYRCIMPLDYLHEKHGITSNIIYPGYRTNEIAIFLKVYLEILFLRKKNSAIVIQKVHTNKIYGRLLKILIAISGKNTVFDIDDADYLKYKPDVIHYFMKHCTCCTCGSNAILKYAGLFNQHLYLLTSPVKSSDSVKHLRNEFFRIGWIGFYNAHRESLIEFVFPAIAQLEFPVRFTLLGVTSDAHQNEIKNYFSLYPNVTIEISLNINWNDDAFIQEKIAAFDAGLAPLNNNEINASKSAFKMKQYLSCGVPVLASPVGENASFLVNGQNGFFCSSAADFKFYLEKLRAMNNQEYSDISANALRSSKSFSPENYCDSFLDIFENAN